MIAINTITVCAYKRREYLNQVLYSLEVALGLCPEFKVSHIVVGVDGGPDKVADGIYDPGHNAEILFWPEHLGVTEAPRRLLQYAFMELGSAFNLHLEDDTVLAPDAIRLVEWFRSQMPDPAHILSLHSKSREYLDPALVEPREDFGVWGWAANSYVARKYILPYWNHKRVPPLGWDYSLTETVGRFGLKVMSPALSRVQNIGREGGAHQTPEGWDEEMQGLVYAGPGSYWMQRIEDFHL